jgi:hypothetical protein
VILRELSMVVEGVLRRSLEENQEKTYKREENLNKK